MRNIIIQIKYFFLFLSVNFYLANIDVGLTAFSQNESSNELAFHAVTLVSPNTVIAVGDSGTIARSTDQGSTWSVWLKVGRITTPLFGVHFSDSNHGYAVGANGAFLVSTDGGIVW